MKLIEKSISIVELKKLADELFGDFVKAVADIDKCIMVIGGELHADEEKILLENGSAQENLWGINLYPEFINDESFIEFNSMINIRPSQNNLSRNVEDVEIQNKIREVIKKLIVV